MSPTDVPPASGPSDRGGPPEDRSGKRNPWLWTTIGVTTAFTAARKTLNESEEQVDHREADVDKANAGG